MSTVPLDVLEDDDTESSVTRNGRENEPRSRTSYYDESERQPNGNDSKNSEQEVRARALPSGTVFVTHEYPSAAQRTITQMLKENGKNARKKGKGSTPVAGDKQEAPHTSQESLVPKKTLIGPTPLQLMTNRSEWPCTAFKQSACGR